MYQRLTFNLTNRKLRRAKLEGRMHTVARASILGPCVIDGSAGPVLYTNEENGKSAPAWNYKPIVVYHPEKDGSFVSACQPHVLNTRKVGVLLNTVNKKTLITECWLDEERCDKVDGRIMHALNKGQTIEVSTGLDFDPDHVEGEFEGKKYKTAARNYRPDHLAILPDQEGAFSIKMGGGMSAFNQLLTHEPEGIRQLLERSAVNALASVGFNLVNNELSFSDISRQLMELLSAKMGEPGKYWYGYLCAVYPEYCIFDEGGKQWRVDYSVESDVVSLSGEPEQVRAVIEYQAVNSAGESTEEKEKDMAFDKKKHLTALIGNGGYTEADRTWLEAMPDEGLERIRPAVVANTSTTTPSTTTKPAQESTAVNLDQYVANAPPEIRGFLQDGVAASNQERDRLVKEIMAHPGNQFPEPALRASPIANLRGIRAVMVPSSTQQPMDPYAPLIGNEANSIPIFVGNTGAYNPYTQPMPTETLDSPE